MRAFGLNRQGVQGWRTFLVRFWRPLALFAAWRLALYVLGMATQWFFPFERGAYLGPYLIHPLVDPWIRWDGQWYVQIAEHGYWHDPDARYQSYAFFPLYPLLTGLLGRAIGDIPLGGFLVANVSFATALVLLYALAEERFGQQVAFRTVLFVTVSPFAFFFGALYTESLFFLLAVASFWFAYHDRPWASGIAAGLCSATRLMGAALAPVLLLILWQRRDRDWRRLGIHALTPTLAVAGLGLYSLYLYATFGEPLAFYRASAMEWYRYNPLLVGLHGLNFLAYVPGDANVIHWFNLAPALLCVVSLPFVWRLLGPGPTLFVLIGLLVPLSAGLESLGRYVSVLFPAHIVLAYYCRGAESVRLIVVTSVLFQAFLTVLFTTWYLVI